MKTILSVLLIAFAIAACDDDSNDGRSSNAKIEEVENVSASGQWRITYFEDSGNDETGKFGGYIFEFDSGNALTATNGSSNPSGTWSVVDDDRGDDDNNNGYDDIDFNIAFTTPADFQELSEDWEIISITASKIELRHVSGGNGGTDLLTFEKVV
jgi:hypothetical protein